MNRTMLLHFYPRAWRVRYQDEFAELLEQMPCTPFLVLDTLRGAVDAHLHPSLTQTARRQGRNAVQQRLLVLAVALALQHPRLTAQFAMPRRLLGSAFMA